MAFLSQDERKEGEFQVIVRRLLTKELAYVWRERAPRFPEGRRYMLKRILVTGPGGTLADVTEGMHLRVTTDPLNPDRITFAEIVVEMPELAHA
jgi:hypothetical protein